MISTITIIHMTVSTGTNSQNGASSLKNVTSKIESAIVLAPMINILVLSRLALL